MDARTALAEWLAEDNPDRRGKQGRLLQGTSPAGYRHDVTDWLDFLERIGIDAWNTNGSHIRTWLDADPTRVAVRSRARAVSALAAFYTYAMHFGHCPYNPAHPALRGRPHEQPGLALLSAEQTLAVQAAADALTTPTAGRDRLMIYLMLAGLRPRQIIELNVHGLHFEQHRMTAEVWQKGGGSRLQELPAPIPDLVQGYLVERVHEGPHSYADRGPLLTSYRGMRLDPNVTPRTVLRGAVIASRACAAAGVPRDLKPDALAHSPNVLAVG